MQGIFKDLHRIKFQAKHSSELPNNI